MADPRHAPIQARVQGVREVLAAAGTSVQDAWDVQVPGMQIEDGITAADRVLALPTRPSALFVSTDRIAIEITHRLLARGRYDGKGSAKPRQILLPPELVVRASCP